MNIELKNKIKEIENKGGKIAEITVSIGDIEEENEYDVNVNIWYMDRWNNKEFEDFTETLNELEVAVKRAETIASKLSARGYRAKYTGIEM